MCSINIFLALVPATVAVQDAVPSWPQFRGPGGLAVAAESPIPLDFGPESRVLWKAEIPAGHSSPCVYGERIFVTGAKESSLFVVALDRASGKKLWTRELEGETEPEYGHVAAAPAISTPCTDGERLFVYFGGYGLLALDLDGETLWEKRMPVPSGGFGSGTSPILAGGRVILMRDGAPEAAVFAFDASDGKEAWSIPRLGFIESHSTPFVWRTEAREELIIAGTKQLRAYDPETGAEIWRVDDVTLLTCTTPAANAKTLFFAGWSTPNASGRPLLEESFGPHLRITDEETADIGLLFDRLDADGDGHLRPDDIPASRAKDAFTYLDTDGNGSLERGELVAATMTDGSPGRNVMVAIAAGGEGDVTDSHVRWSYKRGLPYVSSPLYYRGRVWLFKAGGIVTCLDAETGARIIERARLPVGGEYYMSPVAAAGHVIVGTVEGTLFILDATADELRVVHSADFGAGLSATPAVLEGKVYLRTPETLWAFGD